jgi:uncharacterized NAD(P)/FAD-binding protein YdhS
LTVAIVGGGFTGAAVAYHLARAGVASLVFEPRARLGGGLAYDDPDPAHRINVPASRMSLDPDDGGQFARWLDASGLLEQDPAARAGGEAFPARSAFAAYMADMLAPHLKSGAVRHVRDEAAALTPEGEGWRVVTRAGAAFRARAAVIATTHPAAAVPRELAGVADHPRLVADALAPAALAGVGAAERALIVGAGLTGADVVATLDAAGHEGAIVMISRRGLRSLGHPRALHPAEGDFASEPSRQASALLARVRRAVRASQAEGRGWHPALEAVREQGQEIWAALTPDARRRIVRHVRPYWDVHRFRLAPQTEATLDARLADGSLTLRKARIRAARADAGGFDVDLGAGFERFERIVLATGPAHADTFAAQPYLARLREGASVQLDETGLGLKTSRGGLAIGADGREQPALFVAGPLARGTFGELMGLPAVSVYARFIAERILAARDRAEGTGFAGREKHELRRDGLS